MDDAGDARARGLGDLLGQAGVDPYLLLRGEGPDATAHDIDSDLELVRNLLRAQRPTQSSSQSGQVDEANRRELIRLALLPSVEPLPAGDDVLEVDVGDLVSEDAVALGAGQSLVEKDHAL